MTLTTTAVFADFGQNLGSNLIPGLGSTNTILVWYLLSMNEETGQLEVRSRLAMAGIG